MLKKISDDKLINLILLLVFITTLLAAIAIYPKHYQSPSSSSNVTGDLINAKVIVSPKLNQNHLCVFKVLIKATAKQSEQNVEVVSDLKYCDLIKIGDKVQIYKTSINDMDTSETGFVDPEAQNNKQNNQIVYYFYDFSRTIPLLAIFGAYMLIILLIARKKGLKALLGLIISLVIIYFFTFPCLFAQNNALLVGLISSGLIMYLVIYLAHGFNYKSSTALLGTLIGLSITTIVGYIFINLSHITGLNTEEGMRISDQFQNITLTSITLSGLMIATLGVLNDVTITQSSTVVELADSNPSLSRRSLFVRALKVGHDHIASTIYTISFAYIGSSLPLQMWIYTVKQPLLQKLASEELALQIISAGVGGIGLIIAVPITTALACLFARRDIQNENVNKIS